MEVAKATASQSVDIDSAEAKNLRVVRERHYDSQQGDFLVSGKPFSASTSGAIGPQPAVASVPMMNIRHVYRDPAFCKNLPKVEVRNNELFIVHELSLAAKEREPIPLRDPETRSPMQSKKTTSPGSGDEPVFGLTRPAYDQFQRERQVGMALENKLLHSFYQEALHNYEPEPHWHVLTSQGVEFSDSQRDDYLPESIKKCLEPGNVLKMTAIDEATFCAAWDQERDKFIAALGGFAANVHTVWDDGTRYRTSAKNDKSGTPPKYATGPIKTFGLDGDSMTETNLLKYHAQNVTALTQLAILRRSAGDHRNAGRIIGRFPEYAGHEILHTVRDSHGNSGGFFSKTTVFFALQNLLEKIFQRARSEPVFPLDNMQTGTEIIKHFIAYHPNLHDDPMAVSDRIKVWLTDIWCSGRDLNFKSGHKLFDELKGLMIPANADKNTNREHLERHAVLLAMVMAGALDYCKEFSERQQGAKERVKFVMKLVLTGVKLAVAAIPNAGDPLKDFVDPVGDALDKRIDGWLDGKTPLDEIFSKFLYEDILLPASYGTRVPGFQPQGVSPAKADSTTDEVTVERTVWGRYFAKCLLEQFERITIPAQPRIATFRADHGSDRPPSSDFQFPEKVSWESLANPSPGGSAS